MSRSEWIPLSEPARWREALAGIEHGFTHLPEYSAVAAQVSGHEAGLWAWHGAAGRAACPLALRPAPGGGFDLVTPLGFSGFAGVGLLGGMAGDWMAFWQAKGALAAYVQLSPWRDADAWREALAGFAGELQDSRECWLWDLRHEPGVLLQGMHPNHRRFLAQWQASSPGLCRDPAQLVPAFDPLYAQFVSSRDIPGAYRFTRSALSHLDGAPGTFWLGARDAQGAIEAVALFLWHGRHADLFLQASSPAGRRHSRGLYFEGALHLRALGVETLNLGGGITDGDPLAQFKRRFGAAPRRTLAVRQVLDAEGFGRACACAGVDPGTGLRFPPWLGR